MIFFIILFLLDRLLKSLSLAKEESLGILTDFLSFGLVKNYNIAFSLPLGGLFLKLILFIIFALIIVYFLKAQNKERVYLAAIFLGGISNFYDRLRYGYVIDYMNFFHFGAFNLSDCLIVFGGFALGWLLIKRS